MGRVKKGWGIVAYSTETHQEKISITTFLILIFFIYLLIIRLPLRRKNHSFLIFEKLLLTYAILTTISQFINHNPWNAFLLSISGVWQYVAFLYIISAIARSPNDIRFFIKCILGSILIGIIIRLGSFDVNFLNLQASGEYVRVPGGAFGSAINYGGYLAFTIILAIYLIRSSKSRKARLGLFLITGIMIFELLNTFTRGAWLSLFFLALLPLWKEQRRFIFRHLAFIIPILILFSTQLINLVTSRGLYLDSRIFQLRHVQDRMILFKLGIPHFFDNFGFGYGIGKSLHFQIGKRYEVSHNILLEMSQTIGALATLAFLLMFFFIIWRLFKLSKKSKNIVLKILSPFLIIALLAWFFFANTTSTSIVYYYPYEATLLFYSVLYFALLAGILTNKKKTINDSDRNILNFYTI